jgi:hypothetical protein
VQEALEHENLDSTFFIINLFASILRLTVDICMSLLINRRPWIVDLTPTQWGLN